MEGLKFYLEYDEQEEGITLVQKLKEYFEENNTYEQESITIGYWEEAWEESPKSVINYMIENKSKFPNLKKIYLGDMTYEECEVSWIIHTDVAPLLNEFDLEVLTIKGANGLRLSDVKNDTLKKLTIISGGIGRDLLQDILKAEFPDLEHLELYIGVGDYGFDGDISSLEPFMKRDNFPNLKYLGLKNSEIQDEICEKILYSDIINDLEVLDLSFGTLSDKSAKLILENTHKLSHLKKLDLTYNYISNGLIEEVTKAFSNLSTQLLIDRHKAEIDEEDDWRYPYITE